jgi:hypothetical protein
MVSLSVPRKQTITRNDFFPPFLMIRQALSPADTFALLLPKVEELIQATPTSLNSEAALVCCLPPVEQPRSFPSPAAAGTPPFMLAGGSSPGPTAQNPSVGRQALRKNCGTGRHLIPGDLPLPPRSLTAPLISHCSLYLSPRHRMH